MCIIPKAIEFMSQPKRKHLHTYSTFDLLDGMKDFTEPGRVCLELSNMFCRRIVDAGYLNVYLNIWSEYWDGGYRPDDYEPNAALRLIVDTFSKANTCLQTLTIQIQDESFASKIVELGITEKILKKLGDKSLFGADVLARAKSVEDNNLRIAQAFVGILQCTIKGAPNEAAHFRKYNGLEISKQYLIKLPDTDVFSQLRLETGLTIARTVTEEHQDILEYTKPLVQKYVEMVIECSTYEDYISGWNYHLAELLDALTELASIDSVKTTLVQNKNLLHILYVMLQRSNIKASDVYKILKFLWVLSFEPLAQKTMNNKENDWNGLMKKMLANKEENGLHPDVVSAAEGIVWNLSGSRAKTAKMTENRRKMGMEDRKSSAEQKGHVMISYDHEHQHIVKQLATKLRKTGFNIWFDLDDMKKLETTELPAPKFMRFPCLLECEYADAHGKPVVVVKTQSDYKPDGWLGLFLGKKLYIQCHSPEMIEEALEKITQQLNKQMKTTAPGSGSKRGSPSAKSFVPKRSQSAMNLHIVSNETSGQDIREWSEEMVENWFNDHGLGHLYEKKLKKKGFRGDMLFQLYNLYNKKPQVFCDVLTKMGVREHGDILCLTLAFDDM